MFICLVLLVIWVKCIEWYLVIYLILNIFVILYKDINIINNLSYCISLYIYIKIKLIFIFVFMYRKFIFLKIYVFIFWIIFLK